MPQDHISRKRAVYTIAGMERANIRKDVVYRTAEAGPLTMDLYYPEHLATGARLPAVVLVAGYSDVGYEKMLGVKFKEMAMSMSWGQLIAASGMVAIAYTNREPAADLDALLQHVIEHAASLGVDENRMGVWACSGNVPLALSALMTGSANTPGPKGPGLRKGAAAANTSGPEGPGLRNGVAAANPPRPEGPGLRCSLRCGAMLYGYMLDLDGGTGVAEAAAMFRFANPTAGKSLDDLPHDVPLFIARAGQEQSPDLNDSIDRFVAKALTLNRPITLVNHAEGPHSFDLLHDSDTSRQIIRQTLDFLATQLTRAGS